MIKSRKRSAKIVAKVKDEEVFPEPTVMEEEDIYNLIAKFIRKAVPVKGAKLAIVNGFNNRVSAPRPPYIVLQIIDENQLSTPEIYYTDRYKMIKSISQMSVDIYFYGSGPIKGRKMAKSFVVRFNDEWASEEFKAYGKPLFPLYCEELEIKTVVGVEGEYDDLCSVTAYFEYHPEFGICQDSAREIEMDMRYVKNIYE